jgi:hypothetical protein
MSADISEEDVASFFRVQEDTSMKQVANFMLVSSLASSSTQKVKATYSPETSAAFQRTARRYILVREERTVRNQCCENAKSYMEMKNIKYLL